MDPINDQQRDGNKMRVLRTNQDPLNHGKLPDLDDDNLLVILSTTNGEQLMKSQPVQPEIC